MTTNTNPTPANATIELDKRDILLLQSALIGAWAEAAPNSKSEDAYAELHKRLSDLVGA